VLPAIRIAQDADKRSDKKKLMRHSQMSANLSRFSDSSEPLPGCCKSRTTTPLALIVDDDPDIPPLVESALDRFDVSSDSVNDGATALERLRAHTYDLVILDLAMAGLTGLDVLRSLKREARLQGIPVIVLTADASDEALARSFGYGADDFVVKPFKATELGMRAFRLLYPLTSR